MPVTTEFVTKGADKAAREISKISGGLTSMATTAGKASAALLGAGAAAGALVDDIVGQIDEMNTFAQATGLSIDTIKGLSLEAKRTGKDLKDLVPRDLAKRMREAGAGSKIATEAFGDLGISMEDLERLTPDETFARVIDGLQGMEDSGERAAIASQLLGKNGREMLSAFSNGSDGLREVVELGKDFGINVGPEAQEAASAWQQSTMELSLAFDHAKASIQPFIGTAAGAMSDFALGAIAGLASVSDYVDTVSTRMGMLLSGDFAALADDIGERGFGIQSALNAGVESAWEFDQAIGALTGTTEESPLYGPALPPEEGVSGTLRHAAASARMAKEEMDEWAEGARLWYHERSELEVRAAAQALEVANATNAAAQAAQDYADSEAWDVISVKMDANVDKAYALADAHKAYVKTVATGAISLAGSVADTVANLAKEGSDAAKAAAIVQFAASQAAAIADIAMKTQQAYMAAAIIGPPQSFIAQGIVVAQGIASGLAVASQPPPSFHIGHRAAPSDEYSATLRSRESVLTPGATQALGGPEAVAALNGGMSAAPSGPMALYLDSESVGVAYARAADDPFSTVARSLRAASPMVR